ncbi:hypothetical protein SSX86_029458 [Deinandra increscens subsp. villosa]|uniref:F-box domain-containing protein n=1 Tax=Deinandra increscens subsp. villosa TaxID=3103831 RepID=A0AAP0GK52_9ASTR
MNVEGDRLSSLPDDLIHKVLSFIDIREAIGTSVLCSRWRFIWTSMPYLNFSIEDFSTLPKFSKFVSTVLCRRNCLTDVYSLKLRIRVKESLLFLKRVLNYAFFHHIQQLSVEVKAQKIMAELRAVLEKEKDNTKTNRAHLELGKAHVDESHKPKKLKIGGDMAPVKSTWKNLGEQIEKARLIVSKLQSIEELMTMLPASNSAKIQPCFSTLSAEANIAISMITDCTESGERMDSSHGKMKMNEENDRLSSLPDDLIHKILSFIDIKEAIGTSILSSRWRFIWTSMQYLNFSCDDFSKLPKFSKFATRVLSCRNNLAEVYSMRLSFRGSGNVTQQFVKRILNYATSHNIQQLKVVYSGRYEYSPDVVLTSTSELPSLTTLDLNHITLRDDNADKSIGIISKCANLKNLTLKWFKTTGSDGFSIFHPRLSNLTLEDICKTVKVVNVDAPQLKNLTVRFCGAELVISAPNLASLLYKGYGLMPLSTNGFHTLEKADICFSSPQRSDAHQIVCLLQLLHNAKFLTLNQEIVKILSSSEVPLLHQPSPFVNLKSLKISPEKVCLSEQAPQKVTMSPALYCYLLDGSPKCNFTVVICEEVRARNIMAQLGAILEKWKDNTKTNGADLERGKAHMESHTPKKLNIGGNMAQMVGCWKNLSKQIENACTIIIKVQDIEELLKKLPASKRAEIQPCFSSMCAEADIVITRIKDFMKTPV